MLGTAVLGSCLLAAMIMPGGAGEKAAGDRRATEGAGQLRATEGRGRKLYVDCSAGAAGAGTHRSPWRELAEVNRRVLAPGDSVLLRRGTSCRGRLAPQGSGTPRAPIIIGAWGRGPRPQIDPGGAFPDAVLIADESHVVVQDLELTSPGTFTSPRRGLYAVALHAGRLSDLVIRRLFIHDVEGSSVKGPDGSGGIQIDGAGNGVVIEDNRVQGVNRSGIWVAGSGRPPRPEAGRSWSSATRGVIIRGNVVLGVGGDGIVPTGTDGALVADNVVCCGNLRGSYPRQADAGIWTFAANNTHIERNLVFAMTHGSADGTGYDVDYDQDGTVVRSNIGIGNAGGFTLLCTDNGQRRRALVTRNISLAEYAFAAAVCAPPHTPFGTFSGIRLIANTFLVSSSLVPLNHLGLASSLPRQGSFSFDGNVVIATPFQPTPLPCGSRCAKNVLVGVPRSGSLRGRRAPARFQHPRRSAPARRR